MRRKTRRQKKEQFKRRYEAVKNLMSTFAMSTVAVVAVVTLIPASPKAEIMKTVALSDEIAYQVTVTDEENALYLDTLSVVLENQLEYYEHPIELGENSGFFEDLNTNTEYRLSVYGDKGFGDERLDTVLVTTRQKIGSSILSVVPKEGVESQYIVDVSTYDPDNIYSKIELVYGYRWEPDEELMYDSIEVLEDRVSVELAHIFTSLPFHVYLEGTTVDGTVVLDEIWVTPPLLFNGEIYPAYRNNTEVVFHVYGDYYIENVEYKLEVKKNGFVIQSSNITPGSDYHSHMKWIIGDLNPDTTYLFECTAIFTNPQTLREEERLIYTEEHSTTKDYSYTYELDEFDTYYEVTIILEDPDNVLEYVLYEVQDMTGEFGVYIDGESYEFEVDGDTKIITFTLPIPDVEKYIIFIGMRQYTDTSIYQSIEELIIE